MRTLRLRAGIDPRWLRPLYYVLTAGILTWARAWELFLLYWVLPILTVTQVFVRWGAICEHKYNLPSASVGSDAADPARTVGTAAASEPELRDAPISPLFPGIAFTRLPQCMRSIAGRASSTREHVPWIRSVFGGHNRLPNRTSRASRPLIGRTERKTATSPAMTRARARDYMTFHQLSDLSLHAEIGPRVGRASELSPEHRCFDRP